MKSRKNTGSFNGKGYYIALILCAAAIGISGYLYYRNVNQDDTTLQNPTADTGVISPTEGKDIQAVATQPKGEDPTENTEPSATKPSQQNKVLKTGLPLDGETIYGYAMDCLSYNPTTRDWRVHDGIDIAAEAGTEVLAAAAGTVYTTYEDDTMGTTVVIRHEGGYVTVYSSLDQEISVTTGETVALGQTIGYVANSALLETAEGDHLHFSVLHDDEYVDPAEFFALK